VTIAAVALVAVAVATGAARRLGEELRRRPAPAFRLAVLMTALPFVMIAFGLQEVPTGVASVLVASAPLWATGAAGVRNPLDRPTGIQAVGLVVALFGVALVVGVEALSSVGEALAAGAMLVAACSYAAAGFVVRRHYPTTPVLVTAGVAALPAVPLLVALLVIAWPQAEPGSRAVVSLLALGLLSTAAALVAFYALLRRVGPIRALLTTYLSPAFAVVLGVAVLGEALTAGVLGGLALVVVGMVLATRPDPRMAGQADVHRQASRV
jgi:drug/metabolite transporter (DMT)-like permease